MRLFIVGLCIGSCGLLGGCHLPKPEIFKPPGERAPRWGGPVSSRRIQPLYPGDPYASQPVPVAPWLTQQPL
ncbi:MAG: hypothetical protein KDA89_18295, partial [Planctomycetaceae bacterium]|nr:hypothetical protein [Planctomycetaceae bacterium]